MAKEFFVSAAWINSRKVPRQTAYGTELKYKDNAFRYLSEAVSVSTDVNDIFHVFDRTTVIVRNEELKLRNIRSQEIKATVTDDPAKRTYTGKSQIPAAGTIRVVNTAANIKLDIAGFKNVTILNPNGKNGTYTVRGGSNTVLHVYSRIDTGNTTGFRNSASITGRADGVLMVSGARVLSAYGAWAEAPSISGGISSGASVFIPTDPGNPLSREWGSALLESPLKAGLPGYFSVTLASGASGGTIVGGGMGYSYINSEADNGATRDLKLNKGFKYSAYANGSLSISNAGVGSAYNYATVILDAADFTLLQGGRIAMDANTSRSGDIVSSYATSSSGNLSSGAMGTVVINGLRKTSNAHVISGYEKVLLATDGEFGKVTAGAVVSRTSRTEKVRFPFEVNAGSTIVQNDSAVHSAIGMLSGTFRASGATFKEDVIGFNSVNLSGATFEGMIAGGVFAIPQPAPSTSTVYVYGPCNSSFSESAVWSSRALVESRTSERLTSAAAGAVTLSASEVGYGILGYSTVKLTDVEAGKNIRGGAGLNDIIDSVNRSVKNGADFMVSSNYHRNYNAAVGTLTMSGGALSRDAVIDNFLTVTLNGVSGRVDDIRASNASTFRNNRISSGGGVVLREERYMNSFGSGVGTLTVSNGAKLGIYDIWGFNKVTVTDGTISGGIADGWRHMSSESLLFTYDSKTGVCKSNYRTLDSRAAVGSVQLKDTKILTGGIQGYQKVILDSGTVSGGIVGRPISSGSHGPGPAPVLPASVTYNPNIVSGMTSTEYDRGGSNGGERLVRSSSIDVSSSTATLELTLVRGAKVYGDVVGVKKLTTASGGLADIEGMVDMADERDYASSSVVSDFKKGQATNIVVSASSHTAAGTLAVRGLFVGDIVGAAKVTASVLSAGNIDGTTSSSYSKLVYGAGLPSTTFSSNSIISATGTAEFTSGAIVGTLLGFGNVTAKEGVGIASANGWTDKEFRYLAASSDGIYLSAIASHNVGNSLKANNTHISGGVAGYKSMVFEGYMTDVTGGIDAEQHRDSLVISNTAVSGSVVGQTLTHEHANSIMGEITLKNAAQVADGAYGIRVANLTSGGIVGEVAMSGWSEKETNKLTSNAKTKLFEQNWQDSSGVAGGALTLNKGGYVRTDAGNALGGVYGAANVTVTDGDIEGDVYGCGKENYSSSIVAKGTKIDNYSVLTEDSINVTSESAVEWTEKYLHNNSAAGTFKLNGGFVDGAIENFATVQLRGEADYTSVGRAKGGAVVDSFSHVYKDGSDIYNSSYRKDVLGTLTATNVTFTDGGVLAEGFATVTLTGCTGLGGSIWGGNEEEMRRGVGEGANFAVASRAATGSAGLNEKYTAAGLVTLLSTELNGGSIINCATVTLGDCSVGDIDVYYSGPATLTLNGSNNVGNINGVTSLTVRNGVTNAGNCTGTAGNDNFTVNAGAALNLESCDFGSGSDKAVVNGLARLFGEFANTDQLAFSGNGNVAVTERNYITIQRAIASGTLGDVTFSGGIELINAGANEDLLYAIRTKKEELADNTAKGAVKFAGGDLDGWLSGEEDADLGKFADTADWIKFKYDDDCDYSVALMDNYRHNDVQVEIWKGSQLVDVAEWDNGVFEIDDDDLKNGVEYQLAIKMTNDSSALRYTFMAVENA